MEKILIIALGVSLVFILNQMKAKRFIGSWVSFILMVIMYLLSLIYNGWEVLGFLILAFLFGISFVLGTLFYTLYIIVRK